MSRLLQLIKLVNLKNLNTKHFFQSLQLMNIFYRIEYVRIVFYCLFIEILEPEILPEIEILSFPF